MTGIPGLICTVVLAARPPWRGGPGQSPESSRATFARRGAGVQAAARDLAVMEAAITAQGWMQPFCLLDHSEDEG